MKIVIQDKAKKELSKLQRNDIEKILDKIERLGVDASILDVKRLQPKELGFYRLRVGNYRIIFKINKQETIEILKVDTRQGVYDTL